MSEESVSGELGERVRAIVAAAESMAAAVRADADSYAEARRREADEEAERRLRDARAKADALLEEKLARVSELSDRIASRAEALLAQFDSAESVRRRFAELSTALGEAAERVARELRDDAEGHPMADEVRPLRPPGEQAPAPLRPLAAPHVPRPEPETRLDDARLVALQMAVAGRTREEVAAHLREAFDVGNPDAILDHVFAEGFPPPPQRGA